MRSRPVMLLAVAIAAISVIVVVIRIGPAGSARPPARAQGTLPAKLASYLGVYEKGPPESYKPIATFAAAAGRQPNLAGYFSGWGEPFKTTFATTASRHGAATLVQIDPTGASIAAIAAGDYDDYLRSYADAVHDFGHPVAIGFGHEMNATWYTWGYGHVRAVTFVAAWRHLVTVFRQQGADNVTWLWTIQADIAGSGPIASWWPGATYVSWVGIDGYYYRPGSTFATVFGGTISQVRSFTSKPILLSETSVGPKAGQAAGIQDLFRGMAAYQALGLVWFDISQSDGIYHQDWRLEDSLQAELAFRRSAGTYLHYGP
jgi:mannan endo-1,4-beta-mannosidase